MFKRNADIAQSRFVFTAGNTPQWNKWKVDKAVKDGYVASGWVFRAVNAISNAGSSVPFHVVDKEGTPLPNHNISKLLKRPNPSIPRQELFSLYIQWLLLAGNAYSKKVKVGGRTTELWPISPDKAMPIIGDSWISGYALKGKSGSVKEKISIEDVLHFKLSNPADPTVGISVLEAAAKPVDTDVEQQSFNKTAMQNRGIMDGVFIFKDLAQNQWETVREKIKEMFTGSKNARTPGIIGADANYVRTGMTPAEMDFIESRKFNRDEILLIFGVPPQLVGVQESSTFNNFQTSRRVFWEETVIPMLVKIKDSLNHSLDNELKDGEQIVYDLSNIPAMQDNLSERIKIAKGLWLQGVPFVEINKRLQLGFDDFKGGDLPWGGKSQQPNMKQQNNSESASLETRSTSNIENIRAKHEKKATKAIAAMFDEQRKAVAKAIKDGDDPEQAVIDTRNDWIEALRNIQIEAARDIADES